MLRIGLTRLLVVAVLLVPATVYASASVSIDIALTSGTPIAGTNLQFTVTANNEGPDNADTSSIVFDVPTNSTFVSLPPPPGWSCVTPLPAATGTITCSSPTFAPGSVGFVLTVATLATAPQGTPVTLTASIASTTADPDPDDNTNQRTVLLVWQANLSVTKSGPTNAFSGAALVYTISITNPGPSPAADLSVTDTVAAPLRFVSITAPGWTCVTPAVGSAGAVSCTIAQIPAGTTSLTLGLDTAPSTAPTSVTNDVSVSASTDPAGPRVASATTQLAVSAELTITKSGLPTPPVAGQVLAYTITVTQSGPSDATDVALTDSLPGAVLFQSISAPGWTCATPPAGSSGTISCTRTPLPPGGSTITIQAVVSASTPAGTLIANTASVTSATPDPTVPNTATASAAAVAQADLSVSITDSPDPVAPGASLTYQIAVTNGGPSDAANPILSVLLAPGVGFVSVAPPAGWTCTSPAIGASGTVVCHATSMASGAVAPFTIVASVGVLSDPGGSVLSTSATIASSTTDPNPANNGASASTIITTAAAIPTLSDVAFVALATLLALVALRELRAVRSGRGPSA